MNAYKIIYGVVDGEAAVDSAGLAAAVASAGAAGLAAGAAVSVFCSQAARSAAPTKMQMYFFIFFGSRD